MEIIRGIVDKDAEAGVNCTSHNGGNYDPFTGGGMQCGGSCKD